MIQEKARAVDNLIVPVVIERDIHPWEVEEVVKFNNDAMFSKNNDTPPDHAPPPIAEQEVRDSLEQGGIVRGVFSRNRLVGSMWLIPGFETMYVNVIAVDKDFRSRGMAKKLLSEADTEARSRGLKECILAVDPWNGSGIQAYLGSGYKATGFSESYYGDEYPNSQRLIMTKRLDEVPVQYTYSREVSLSSSRSLTESFKLGFEGVKLLRSNSRDPRRNRLVLRI